MREFWEEEEEGLSRGGGRGTLEGGLKGGRGM